MFSGHKGVESYKDSLPPKAGFKNFIDTLIVENG